MKSALSLSLLLFVSGSYAATEATYINPVDAKQIGQVSFFKAGSATQSEVIESLSKKSDALGGTHFVVTSLNAADTTYATANVYH